MRVSFSRISLFRTCPYRFKLKYIDEIEPNNNQDITADNALILGSALHAGIEGKDPIAEYYDSYEVINDLHVNFSIQLENMVKKCLKILPTGKHELEITLQLDNGNTFLGYVDLLGDDNNVYDFKYTTISDDKISQYEKSIQLSVYKYILTKLGYKVNDLYYVLVPKSLIRQKRDEDLYHFRERLKETIEPLEPVLVKHEYDETKAIEFLNTNLEIDTYEKRKNDYCKYCEYYDECQNINKNKEEANMQLPKNQRRDINSFTRRKMWIYGAPFTGKTTLLDSAPDPLNLNTDGNISNVTMQFIPIKDEIKTQEGSRIVDRKLAWEVFKETISELEKKQNDFKTIIIDLVEDVREACRVYEYEKLGIQHESDAGYGKGYDIVKNEFLNTMKRFFNLDYENLIIVSHEDLSKSITKKDGAQLSRCMPNIQEGLAAKLAGMVDIVARVVINDDGTRSLTFKQNEVIFGGGRLRGLTTTSIPLDWNELTKLYDSLKKQDVNKTAAATEDTTKAEKPEKDAAPKFKVGE